LSRLRQRYALHFIVPDGVRAGEERRIQVELTASAARRYSGAELRYRHVYLSPSTTGTTPAEISSDSPATGGADAGGWRTADASDRPSAREDAEGRPQLRRRPVNETTGARGPMTSDDPASMSRGAGQGASQGSDGAWKPIAQDQPQGGWRKATPEEIEGAGKAK
jgi:hypothetical protein